MPSTSRQALLDTFMWSRAAQKTWLLIRLAGLHRLAWVLTGFTFLALACTALAVIYAKLGI